MTADPYAELEAALEPLRSAQPGITNAEAARLLPPRLRQQLWERAIGLYLDDKLAKVEPEKPTETVETVGGVL